MGEKERVKRLVAYYINLCGTSDPFKIARQLKIQVQFGDIGQYSGCYLFAENHRCIFLNDNLGDLELLFVMAHELGHAIMHRKQNCYFLRNHTYLNSVIEREANLFAANMVITDEMLSSFDGCSSIEIAELYGCDHYTIDLRLKSIAPVLL